MKTVRLIIKGKVQGVFFRATAKEVADKIGVKGWVKNLPDYNVEIMATGTDKQVQQLIEWSREGPPSAEVDEVIIEEMQLENFVGFQIKR